MNDVQFDIDQYDYNNYNLNNKSNLFVDLLIKYGITKTKKQAYIILILISSLILVFSFFLMFGGDGYNYVDKNSYVPAEI